MSLTLAGLEGRKAALLGRYLSARGVASGCIAIVGWEGDRRPTVATRRRATTAVLKRHGGRAAGRRARGAPGPRAASTRPTCATTCSPAASWSRRSRPRRRGRTSSTSTTPCAAALGEHAPFVACHVSHLYATGASLYFTFLARQDAADPIGQWQAAKSAACDAIIAAGGTITHHHAIGRDHARWLAAEDGADRRRGAARAQGRAGPAGDHESGQAAGRLILGRSSVGVGGVRGASPGKPLRCAPCCRPRASASPSVWASPGPRPDPRSRDGAGQSRWRDGVGVVAFRSEVAGRRPVPAWWRSGGRVRDGTPEKLKPMGKPTLAAEDPRPTGEASSGGTSRTRRGPKPRAATTSSGTGCPRSGSSTPASSGCGPTRG